MGDKKDVWQGTLALMVLKTLQFLVHSTLRHRSPDRTNQR